MIPWTTSLTARDLRRLGVEVVNLGSGLHIARDYASRSALYVDSASPPAGSAAHPKDARIVLVDGCPYLRAEIPPIPLSSGAATAIVCEHLIEHLTPRAADQLCVELHRVLAPGGVVRLSTPDLKSYCRNAFGRGFSARRFRRMRSEKLAEMIGDVPDLEEFDRFSEGVASRAFLVNQVFYCWGHRWVYDFSGVAFLLRRAGVLSVKRRRFGRGDPRVAIFDYPSRQDESLHVEASVST